jgi:hypothetical protein
MGARQVPGLWMDRWIERAAGFRLWLPSETAPAEDQPRDGSTIPTSNGVRTLWSSRLRFVPWSEERTAKVTVQLHLRSSFLLPSESAGSWTDSIFHRPPREHPAEKCECGGRCFGKAAVRIAAVGVAAGLLLALLPHVAHHPAGVRRDVGFVDKRTVSCGLLFLLKNPHVVGYDDECDAEHVRRGALAVAIVLAGLLLGCVARVVSTTRSRYSRGDMPTTDHSVQ